MSGRMHWPGWVGVAVLTISAPWGGQGARAEVTLVGGAISIRNSGAFWPAVEYNALADAYLVLWVDVADVNGWRLKGRRVDASTGGLLGVEFHVSPDPAAISAIIGAVAYNSTSHEWFIAYQYNDFNPDQDDVYGQRIGSDGVKIGGAIALVDKSGYQNGADVAYNPTDDNYLVVWQEQVAGTLQAWGRLVSGAGVPLTADLRLSEVDNRAKYNPHVAYSPYNHEFLVVWQDMRHYPGTGQDNDYADIYGQRVHPTTGQKIGVNIPIYSPINNGPYAPNGQDAPNGIVANPTDGSYAIGLTKLTAALGWVTWGLVIDGAGTMIVPAIPLSHPNFGFDAGPVYNPTTNTYFMSYERDSWVAGKLISPGGVVLGSEGTIISTIGGIRNNVIAIRPSDGQCFQVAISDGGGQVVGQRFVTGQPVTGFTGVVENQRIDLSWTNPTNGDFAGTMIRFRTDAFPSSPSDGTLLIDQANTPGSTDGHAHTGLTNGLTYYYAAFAHNATPVYAPPAFASGEPFFPGDFDNDGDVDLTDFGHLQACMSGTGNPYPPGCDDADMDDDFDVDADDFGEFQLCMGGAGSPPGC